MMIADLAPDAEQRILELGRRAAHAIAAESVALTPAWQDHHERFPAIPLMWAREVIDGRLLAARRLPVSYACRIAADDHEPPQQTSVSPPCFVGYYDADAGMLISCRCACHTAPPTRLALEFT